MSFIPPVKLDLIANILCKLNPDEGLLYGMFM